MFMLKVLFRSKTGGYLAFVVFSLICGAIGEMYFPSGAFSNFDGLISWFLFTVTSLIYGVVMWLVFTLITVALHTIYDDLKETAEKIREEEK